MNEELILFRLNKQDEDSVRYRNEVKDKLDTLIVSLKESRKSDHERHDRIEDKIQNLNQWKWITIGGLSAVTTIIGWYIAYSK